MNKKIYLYWLSLSDVNYVGENKFRSYESKYYCLKSDKRTEHTNIGRLTQSSKTCLG